MSEEKNHVYEMHEHVNEDGTVIRHSHGEQGKTHNHSEQDKAHTHNHDEHEKAHIHNHDEHEKAYTHNHDEHEKAHTHNHGEHGHTHSHTHTKAVLNRLSRAIGHLEAIRRMVEDGRDCTEVLIQLSAVKAAINNTGKVILQDHIEHCIVDAVEEGNKQAIEELALAIERFIK